MSTINPLGFLGLVGLIGFLGFFGESPSLFGYFAYLGYLYYFSVPYTPTQRTMTLTALALAYIMAFGINLAFVVASGMGRSINYESGFYLAYSVGSYGFPIVFAVLKIREGLRKRRMSGQPASTGEGVTGDYSFTAPKAAKQEFLWSSSTPGESCMSQ